MEEAGWIEHARATSVHRRRSPLAYLVAALNAAAPPPTPRVAPTLALLALCLPIALVVGAWCLALAMHLDGTSSADDASSLGSQDALRTWYEANFATPKGVLALLLPTQLTFLLLALVPAILSPTPFVERLALARPRIRASTFALALAGTIGVQLLVETVGEHVLGPPSPALKRMADLMVGSEGAFAVALLLGAGLVPGFCEELFFRGYAQSRLVARYGFAAGMILPTLVFALAHGDPQHMLLVVWIGAWVAYLAWRAESTWVSIACHAWNNFAAILIARGVGIGEDGALETPWFLYAGGALGLVCAVIAVLQLERDARERTQPRSGTTRALDGA